MSHVKFPNVDNCAVTMGDNFIVLRKYTLECLGVKRCGACNLISSSLVRKMKRKGQSRWGEMLTSGESGERV